MEKLEKDLTDYSKGVDSKEMKKDMKKSGAKVKKDLEKYAKDVKKDQDRESEMGFMAPSDISFTGTDGYTYIRRDYHEFNPIKVQKVLDSQSKLSGGLMSSYANRKG
ncbi:MAG: hypothetical protein ACOCRO_01815 [Halanaerobiales bacterium]